MADPVSQFIIKPIIPFEVAGVDLSFTNSSLWMMIAAVLSITFFSMAMRQKAMVPGRLQMFSEMMYGFVGNMIKDNLGNKGREYFPLVFTLFIVVLMGNMLGMIPHSFTYTSHLIVTGVLALLVFFTVLVIGIARHGFDFISLFVPPGVPLWLMPLIVPIELLSFLVRPITLSVRLFANMMAGHLILKVFAGFSVAMAGMGAAGIGMGLLPAAFNVAIVGFEFLIAFLQAYVFAILSCIYLKDTLEVHH